MNSRHEVILGGELDNIIKEEMDELGEDCDMKEDPIDLPLSQNTMSALTRDLGFENLDNIIVVSQGSSQKSVGDVCATITVSAFEQRKVVKSSPWIYSSALDRLFVKNNERVPLLVTCQGTFHMAMSISAYVKFYDIQYLGAAVEVCPNHIKHNEKFKMEHPRHMLQYQGERIVRYTEPPETADYCIRIPVLPDAFNQGQAEAFMFSCLSSCVTVARRNVSFCAELHYKDQTLSKVEIPLKISASPMRDMMHLEQKNNAGEKVTQSNKRPRRDEPSSTVQAEILVRVKGRKHIEDLKQWLGKNVSRDHYVIYSAQD